MKHGERNVDQHIWTHPSIPWNISTDKSLSVCVWAWWDPFSQLIDAGCCVTTVSIVTTGDHWPMELSHPVTTGAAQHYCHQLPVYKRIHTLQKLKYSVFYFLHIPKVPCPQCWLVQFVVMSNRCFLSSFTLRLYLLIFWTSVEQCRGLEKCCPVELWLLCVQSDIICSGI